MSTLLSMARRDISQLMVNYYNSCLTISTSGIDEHEKQQKLNELLTKALDDLLKYNKIGKHDYYLFCYTFAKQAWNSPMKLEYRFPAQILVYAQSLEEAYHEFAMQVTKQSITHFAIDIHNVIIR